MGVLQMAKLKIEKKKKKKIPHPEKEKRKEKEHNKTKRQLRPINPPIRCVKLVECLILGFFITRGDHGMFELRKTVAAALALNMSFHLDSRG